MDRLKGETQATAAVMGASAGKRPQAYSKHGPSCRIGYVHVE